MKQVDSTKLENYTNEIKSNLAEGQKLNYEEISIIKTFGSTDEEVNLNMNFLGLDLSSVPTENMNDYKVYIIPILYVLSSIISIRLTNPTPKKKKDEEMEVKENQSEKSLEVSKEKEQDPMDQMAQMNKNMMFFIPIMSVSIAMIAPLGLALYWLVSNVFTTIERIVLNKVLEKKDKEEA